MSQERLSLLRLLPLAVISTCSVSFAAEDDIVVEAVSSSITAKDEFRPRAALAIAAEAAENRQFESQIFTQDQNIQRGRWRINSELHSAINTLDRACRLTDLQKQKLELVGRKDRIAFFDRVETARELSRSRPGMNREAQLEIQSLRGMMSAGLLGPESFFAKSIKTILTEEQLAECWRANEIQRIAVNQDLIRIIDARVKLEPSQREAILKILQHEVSLPVVFWKDDDPSSSVELIEIAWRLSSVAEERLQPLLTPAQWQDFQPSLKDFRSRNKRRILRHTEPLW